MAGGGSNKSGKNKLHGSTNSLKDAFNQAMDEATVAEQAKPEAVKPNSTQLSLSGDLAYPRKQFPVKSKDTLLDYWWHHHLEPQSLNYLYDRGFLKTDKNGDLIIDPYIDTWAKRKGFNTLAVRDIMRFQTDRSIQPGFASESDNTGAMPSFSESLATDVYPNEYVIRDQGHTPYKSYYYRSFEEKNTGQYTPIEGNSPVYSPESSINNKEAKTSVARDFDEKSYLNRDKYNDVKSEIPNTDIAQSRETHAGPYPVPLNRGSWYDLTPIKPDHFDMGPGGYPFLRTGRDPFDFLYLKKDQPSNKGKLTGLGYAGLTGLALAAPYLKQDNTNEQSQTQVPYRMEPEAEEETFGLNLSTSVPKEQYVSPASSIKIDPVKDKELIDEAMSDFVYPQEPPALDTKIQSSSLTSPDADEVPEELNGAMLEAKPGSFWKTTRSVISPRINAAKNVAQNVFERVLARSKAAPKTSNGSTSNIQDTFNSPVVLNDPNHRKTRDVQNNSVTPEQAAASQIVNQYAGIPVEVIRAKNSGYSQPPLNHATDAIWDRVRKAGLSSPEQAIRSGLFTPAEVRYITENDLWRYR